MRSQHLSLLRMSPRVLPTQYPILTAGHTHGTAVITTHPGRSMSAVTGFLPLLPLHFGARSDKYPLQMSLYRSLLLLMFVSPVMADNSGFQGRYNPWSGSSVQPSWHQQGASAQIRREGGWATRDAPSGQWPTSQPIESSTYYGFGQPDTSAYVHPHSAPTGSNRWWNESSPGQFPPSSTMSQEYYTRSHGFDGRAPLSGATFSPWSEPRSASERPRSQTWEVPKAVITDSDPATPELRIYTFDNPAQFNDFAAGRRSGR
jgi:hypothetical protein